MCRMGEIMQSTELIKDLPLDERPYEKCEKLGSQALSDGELLAVLLRTGSHGQSALALARRLLSLPECKCGIQGITHLRMNRLRELKGIGKVKAIQLLCLAELSRRIAKSSAGEQLSFTSPETIAAYYMEDLRHEQQEQILAVYLNTRGHLICDRRLFRGTVSASLASPREIFMEALRCEAANMILLHNHPSGDPTPSQPDMEITERVFESGKMLDIPLLDHIIIGDRRYFSFREARLL